MLSAMGELKLATLAVNTVFVMYGWSYLVLKYSLLLFAAP
jgi:hypothetical protein